MNAEELKQEYNRTLERLNRESVYMDDPKIPLAEKEKYVPAFLKLIQKSCNISDELERLGVTCTDDEYLYGFMIEGRETDE